MKFYLIILISILSINLNAGVIYKTIPSTAIRDYSVMPQFVIE